LILVQSASDRSAVIAAVRPAAYNKVNYDIRRHRITAIDGRPEPIHSTNVIANSPRHANVSRARQRRRKP